MTSLCRLDLGPYGPTLQFQSRIKQRQHFDFSHVVFPKNLRRQIDVLLAEDIIFEGLFWVHGWDPPMLFISQCHPKSPAVPRPDPWPRAPWIDPAEDRHLDCREGKHQRQSQGVRGGLGHG